MKTWIFRETGEVKKPQRGEWFTESISFQMAQIDFEKTKYPILSLEVHDEDPMYGIKVVYESHKHLDRVLSDPSWGQDDSGYSIAGEFYRACKKAVEGK